MNKTLLYAVKILLLCLLLMTGSIFNRSHAQTTLAPGDIAFIAMEMSGSPADYFEFVTLVDLWPCTVVNFTDNQYRTNGTFCTDEFSVGFTVTQKIPAGTIVRYSCTAIPGSFTMSAGAAIPVNNGAGSNNGLSSGNDNITCYQGILNTGSQVNIAAIHNNTFTSPNSCGDSNVSALPAGLTLGINAIQTGSTNDNRRYNCATTSGTKTALANAINNASNWQNGSPSTCTFTVSSVPSCSSGPVAPPTTFNCTGTTTTTSSFSWARCNNMEVTVVARETADPATDPVNGVNYTPNTAYGSGSALGSGFVVYEGTNTSITVTNLTPGTSYTFDIYTYYSTSGICFNSTQLSGTCNTTALPVELLFFHVNNESNLLLFEWATASETNNDHFEIEGSKDGIHFNTIEFINGIGDSKLYNRYNFSRLNNESYQYFRLKEVDTNNEVYYSTIEQIMAEQSTVEVFPIPVSEKLFIRLKNPEQTKITIFDLSGKELHSTIDLSDDVHTLDLRSLNPGTYFLYIQNASQNICKKFYKW